MKSNFLIAYGFAKVWVSRKTRDFTSENIRAAFEEMHPTVFYSDWGNIMTALQRDRIIYFNQKYVKCERVSSKSRWIRVYISRYFSELQHNNRIYKQLELEFTD